MYHMYAWKWLINSLFYAIANKIEGYVAYYRPIIFLLIRFYMLVRERLACWRPNDIVRGPFSGTILSYETVCFSSLELAK